MTDTVLTLTGIGIVPFAGGGISETLRQIDQARQMRRSVNGALTDLSLTKFRKYAVSLSGGDVQPMALDGVWPGKAVTVGCITELGHAVTLTAGEGTVALDRKPVAGSGRAIILSGGVPTHLGAAGIEFSQDTDGVWFADVDFDDTGLAGAAYVFYRPELDCLVTSPAPDTDEWAATQTWTLELEEV